jgi:hypothetical protein
MIKNIEDEKGGEAARTFLYKLKFIRPMFYFPGAVEGVANI